MVARNGKCIPPVVLGRLIFFWIFVFWFYFFYLSNTFRIESRQASTSRTQFDVFSFGLIFWLGTVSTFQTIFVDSTKVNKEKQKRKWKRKKEKTKKKMRENEKVFFENKKQLTFHFFKPLFESCYNEKIKRLCYQSKSFFLGVFCISFSTLFSFASLAKSTNYGKV